MGKIQLYYVIILCNLHNTRETAITHTKIPIRKW